MAITSAAAGPPGTRRTFLFPKETVLTACVLPLLLLMLLQSILPSIEALAVSRVAPRMGTFSGQTAGTKGTSIRARTPTRWDNHLDLARYKHRTGEWSQVRELCSRVITCSDEWNAVEQAHLRLALAEQKDKRVDAARRAFQQGTAACPCSDTLFMAWALMESKIHNARSRRVARALLRRAVALNPSRHQGVLKWRVFLDWKEVGEAAVEAVRTALANGQTVVTVSSAPTPAEGEGEGVDPFHAEGTTVHPIATTTSAASAAAVAAGATASVTVERSKAAVDAAAPGAVQTGSRNDRNMDSVARASWSPSALASTNGRHHRSPQASIQEPRQVAKFVASWGRRWAEEREHNLATDLLDLCKATAVVKHEHSSGRVSNSLEGKRELETRVKELSEELEKVGGGFVGGSESGGREMSGSWRLVFTTCETCNRVLARVGSEVYQRLTPPITELAPRAGEPPVPFRCEVLVHQEKSAASTEGIFFRGWADMKKRNRGCVWLRQQVAPRSAGRVAGKIFPSVGGGSGVGRTPPAPTPPAVFRALGHVGRGGGAGLEQVVTQDVTYVGQELRIGRTQEGDVYVYERCEWPEEW